MDLEWCLTVAGLSIDILGVLVLFITTSARRIEAEISIKTRRQLLEKSKGREWGHRESYEETDEGVKAAESKVDRNKRWQRSALLAIVVGFFLQLLAQLL